jgi:hypothetical protein
MAQYRDKAEQRGAAPVKVDPTPESVKVNPKPDPRPTKANGIVAPVKKD